MKRVRLYVLASIALVAAVLVPWIGKPVRAQGNPKVEFIHTGDWQSGDEVSFTVRGVVEDDKQNQAEKQPDSMASATIHGEVELKDDSGKTTRIQWAPLLHYTVPAAEGFVTATLIDAKGFPVATTRIPVSKAGTHIAFQTVEPPTGSVAAPPIAQVGKPYRISSPAGRLTGRGGATLIARGSAGTAPLECKSLAESPHSAVFEVPKGLKSGPATFTLKEDFIFEATFPVSVIAVNLDTRRVYKVGQPGVLVLEVAGFPTSRTELHKLMGSKPAVSLVNETSAILAFTHDPERIAWDVRESEVHEGTWRREIRVIARHAGKFEITATATAPGLINPTGGTAFYKGPSPPAGPGDKGPGEAGGHQTGPGTKPEDSKPPEKEVTEKPGDAKPPAPPVGPAQKPEMCGPDVTDNYIAQLMIIKDRLRRSKKQIDAMGHEKFMRKNGMQMDYWVGTSASCPTPKCVTTLTFAGLCVNESFTNDVMYGFIGRMLDIPLETLIAAGDVQEVAATGNTSGKPPRKVAGYSVGWDLAREPSITIDAFLRLMQEDQVNGRRARDLITAGCENCSPCPETTSPINGRNFGAQEWVLK